MHPSQVRALEDFAYVPIIMSVIVCVFTGYLFIIKSNFRISARGFSYLSAAIEFFATVLHFSVDTTSFMSVILYALSCSFAYIAVWCAFYSLLKKGSNVIVRCLLYFGWIWAFVTVSLGIVVAFMLRENYYLQYSSRKDNPLFLYDLCNWVFILTIWVALAFTHKKKAYSSKTMIAYAIFTTISATFFTISTYAKATQNVSEFVSYFIGNATAYTANAIVSFCCLDWMTERIDDIELGGPRPANIGSDNDSQITLTENWIQQASR